SDMTQQLQTTDVTGEVLRPGDEAYDDAARAFFGEGAPALVARPSTADEVAAAIAHAVRDDLAISVRSGGHSPMGHSTNTGGMVIDLRHLDGVEILDHDRRLVRVGGGANWGAVGAALDPHDLGLTSGDTTSVGVGGLTLGGGMGWMVRRHGLAIDNLVSARVVTADGRLVTASADENPELFWAIRGGGGNFGVVVDFDFVAQEVASVHYGAISYQLDDPVRLMVRWRDAMRKAPEELSSTLALMPRMPGAPPAATVLLCYAGAPGTDVQVADAAIEPLLELGTVTEATITERRYADVFEEAQHPPGVRMVGRNTLVRRLDGNLLADVDVAHRGPAPTVIALRSLGGAFARVPAEATAFAHRDAEAMIQMAVFLPAATTDADVTQALGPWEVVAARGTGTYVNFQASATVEDLAAAYPPATMSRLVAVKRANDPDNVFALNHNIEPAHGG
ncbi:MAG TPA: FAD-binding oxidoreductase, partial [Actinophytocola sp.]|nr:FAD-binding oxidoreductase [Actinophytocola sp.]